MKGQSQEQEAQLKIKQIQQNIQFDENNQQYIMKLKKERIQACAIYEQLISNDANSIKDLGNFVKRNILKVSGQDFSIKNQKQNYNHNLQRFKFTTEPFNLLKEVVSTHYQQLEKRNQILKKQSSLQILPRTKSSQFNSLPRIKLQKQRDLNGEKQMTHGIFCLLPQTYSNFKNQNPQLSLKQNRIK